MNDQSFSLQPFPLASPLPNLKITGNIARHVNRLTIRYALLGPLTEVMLPLASEPARKHRLWEETCFEFFLGVKNSPQYWEFNLSPAGDWNVYRFAAYRQGMQAEMAFMSLPFSVQNQPDSLLLVLELDLDQIVQATQALEAAISAVIKHGDDGVTYWALTHPGRQADFHQRSSFITEL